MSTGAKKRIMKVGFSYDTSLDAEIKLVPGIH